MTTWEDLHARDVAFARKSLLQFGEMRPMIAILSRKKTIVLRAQWNSDDERAAFIRQLAMLALSENAAGLTFMSEGWLRHVVRAHNETLAEHQARVDAIRPREAEDRVETLNVFSCGRDDDDVVHTLSTMFEIVRDAEGKITDTKLLPRGDRVDSWLTNCLPKRNVSPGQRALAIELLRHLVEKEGTVLHHVRVAGVG